MKNYTYKWSFKDYPVSKNGFTVMSTFACGGGSTMGYKLAGFDVVAANDIDKEMSKVYQHNHHPKQFFECSVTDLINATDLPEVDILDGSPPCSVFSSAGLREKAWGKEKKFREGQASQVLDSLFYEFSKLVGKMRPKVVIAENVKGILHGNAKKYAEYYVRRMNSLGYSTQIFLMDGSKMGLPQKRERVFFISNRLGKRIDLSFNLQPIPFSEVSDNTDTQTNLSPLYQTYWDEADQGESVGKFKTRRKLILDKPGRTITASGKNFHPIYKRTLNKNEELLMSSFPQDYDFLDMNPTYLMGMSVPPIMMAQIAEEVYKQILS